MSRVPRRTRLHLSLLGLVALGLALATASPAHAAEAGGGGGVLLVVAAVVGLILLGEPLFVIIGVLATLCFFLWGEGYDHYEAYQIFVVKMANLTTKNVLLAIPFFVISGAIMTAGGIAERLVSVAKAVVGSLPGGLAMATVGACIFFAAISGSSPVTVIAIGSMIFPALLKEGYGERFSLGLIASAGSLGILIPPSIPMLVYAIVASATATVDVGELFLAGVLPGVFLGGLMCTYAFAVGLSARRASGEMDTARLARTVGGALLLLGGGALAAWLLARYVPALLVVALLGGSGYFLYRFRRSFWALLLPILILGGIYSGLFTPTEAAAVSVVYALVVELFIHRELRPGDVPGIFVESGVLMGALLVIMALAFGLNDFLVEAKVPDLAVAAIKEMELSPLGFLLVVNLLLIVVGFFMDSVSAILIIVPLLVPVARRLGIDPVHLGIVFIVNLEIGYLTPPIGLNLFVASTVFERPMGTVIRSVLPFIALMLVGLGVVTYVPSLSLGPVNLLLRGKPFYEPLPAGLGEPVP
ncbi:MAG: TRAP transporter large permease, partial [Deltaproteobacteria bacterium]